MGAIGEYFKLVRETKRLSMDEVAMKTRIHPEFLRALEEENFAKLPDQVFVKGFVRSYARSLGLDEEEAIRRFDESSSTFYSKQDERERLRVKQAEDERRRKANKKAVVAAAGVALLVLALLFTREQSAVSPDRSGGSDGGRRAAALPNTPIKPVEAIVKGQPRESVEARTPVESAPKPVEPAPVQATESVPEPAPLPPPMPLAPQPQSIEVARVPEPLELELQALELSWVLVQVDEGQPQEVLLKRGDHAKWSASEKFVVTLGNAGGVHVEMNGKPQGPFGPSGKVVRDIILTR